MAHQKSSVMMTPMLRDESAKIEGVEGGGPLKYDKAQARAKAHMTAVEAGGFRKHGANGNMVRSKSSAIADHDKDK